MDERATSVHEDHEVKALKHISEMGLPMTFDDEDFIE